MKHLLFLSISVFSFFLHASLPDDCVTKERFPDADSVLLDDEEKVFYNTDGTYDREVFVRTKILTEVGKKKESTQTINYSLRYGSANFEEIVVQKQDGRKIKVDLKNLVKDSTDNSSKSANVVDPLDRKIVCRVPGLEIGDIISVKIRRKNTKSRIENRFADVFVFETTSPVLRSRYELSSPKSMPIVKSVLRNEKSKVHRTVVEKDDRTVQIFTATNTPQMFPEPSMPEMWKEAQHLIVSTVGSWKEFSEWYWKLSSPHIEKTTAAMTNLVDELITPEAIFKFVSQDIRYMGLTMEDTSPGYAPHDVDVTFNNRYGVCRDKAALLVALLRIGGYNAYPVLINAGSKLDPEVPVPYFNHAVVALEKDGEYVLMDPTNENTRDMFPSYLSNCSYLVARPEGEDLLVSPVASSKENSISIDAGAELSSDGSLFYTAKIDFAGINDTAYRGFFAKSTKPEIIRFCERQLKKISPFAEIINVKINPADVRDTSEPLSLCIIAKFSDMMLKGEKTTVLSVPLLGKSLGVANYLLADETGLAQRKYTLELSSTARVEETLKIEFFDGIGKNISLPDDLKKDGKFEYSLSYALDKSTLEVRRVLAVNDVEFSPDEYDSLKLSIAAAEKSAREKPRFAVNRLENADVRIMEKSLDCDIADPYSYVQTNEFALEVLSYAGLKNSSEMEFEYNPSFERISVEATVSNKNGTVLRLTDKEKNVLDCAWAASAPRYPASKILVLNLPGVEIGSVIRGKFISELSSAPAPYYNTFFFDAFLPIDGKRLSCGAFRRSETMLRILPEESFLPNCLHYRDMHTVSKTDWHEAAARLKPVCQIAPFKKGGNFSSMKEIRDYLALNIAVRGPALYEIPLESHATSPDVVLKEGYASQLDYIRTMVALLKGARFDATIVFAANNSGDTDLVRKYDIELHPNLAKFSTPLAKVSHGGKEYFIGFENEYTPVGATAFCGSDYFDPLSESFGKVVASDEIYEDMSESRISMDVRDNGAVDYKSCFTVHGHEAGVWIKKHNSLVPEELNRYYQGLLSSVSHAAESQSELFFTPEGYPFRQEFSCFIPNYAVVDDDVMTVTIPHVKLPLPNLPDGKRELPILLKECSFAEQIYSIAFPEGYKRFEYLPKDMEIRNPLEGNQILYSYKVRKSVENGVLKVVVKSTTFAHKDIVLPSDCAPLLRHYCKEISSQSTRSISVSR